MFEELNERRKAVERNIAKSFGTDDDVLELEKAIEDEFEKGRAKKTFAIGDTFTRHGITYRCTGISANTGRPTWSKVKDGGGKQDESNSSVDKVKDFLKKLSPSYTDISKVTAFKMKNGDIAVLYDGNSVATLSDSAGKMLEDAGIKIEKDDKKKSKMVQDQLEDEEPEESSISEKDIEELNNTKARQTARAFYEFNCSLVDACIFSATVLTDMEARSWGSNYKSIRIDRIGDEKMDLWIKERDVTTIPKAEKAIRKFTLEKLQKQKDSKKEESEDKDK